MSSRSFVSKQLGLAFKVLLLILRENDSCEVIWTSGATFWLFRAVARFDLIKI